MTTITCSRCRRDVEPMPEPPIPGAGGREIQQRVCAACWAEWQGMEVMVINELRLNFMDPSAQATLDAQMRQFLALDGDAARDAPSDAADPSDPQG